MRQMKPHRLLSALVCLAFGAATAHATDLPVQITTDTTLVVDASPYHLVATTTVAAGVTLEVEPGVEIVATGDHQLRIEGKLVAEGHESASVGFRPLDGDAIGAWQGIFFTATGEGHLQYARVRGARTNITVAGGLVNMSGCRSERAQTDGMYVFGDAYVRVANCYFIGNGRRGLYIETTSPSGSVWRSHFIGNGEYPVYAKATCAEMLRRGNRYHSNGLQRIGVSCSASNDISDVDVWYEQDGLPYDLTAGTGAKQLTISGHLHVEAGVTIIGTDIEVTGTLNSAGTADRPVIIGGPTPVAGTWTGITLRPGAIAYLQSTVIRHADSGITADGADLTLDDCELLDNLHDGVRAFGGARVDVSASRFQGNGRDGLRLEGCDDDGLPVRDCSFIGNQRYPVYAHAASVRLLGGENQYQTNGLQRIGVACHLDPDLSSGLHTWTTQAVPFDLTARPDGVILHVGSAAVLNLGPAATVLGGGIHVRGQFNVAATLANRCFFDAAASTPQPGDWEGIRYDDGASGILKGADIRNANHGLEIHSAHPRIEQCNITECKYDGMRISGTAEPVVYETSTVDNGRYGVHVSDTARPNFGNTDNADTTDDGLNHIHGNGSYQVYNLSPHDIYMHNNWWGTTDLEQVRAATYDHYDNPAVGELLVEPMRASGAGHSAPTEGGARTALVITSASVQTLSSGAVQLTYRVSADCRVHAQIRNIAGRPVAQISQDADPDRLMTLLWDGRSAHGTVTPPGRYLCILQAHGADGQSSRVIVPLDR